MQPARLIFFLTVVLVAAPGLLARDAARDLRKMVGYTIVAATTVRNAADGVVILDDESIFKLDDSSLTVSSGADVIVFAKKLPGTEFLAFKVLIDNEAYEATPVRTEPRGSKPLDTQGTRAKPGFRIEALANDEAFVVGGSVFKARTYCFGFNEGDEVVFTTGGPGKACTMATFLRVRDGKSCNVWCQ